MKNNNKSNQSIKIRPVQPRYINLHENIFSALDIYETRVYLALRYQADYKIESSEVELTIDELIRLSKVKRSTLFVCLKNLENKHFLIRRVNWEKNTWGKANEYEVAQTLNYFKPEIESVKNENITIEDQENECAYLLNNIYINGSYIEGVQHMDYIVQHVDDIVQHVDDTKNLVHEVNTVENENKNSNKKSLNINDLLNINPLNLPKELIEDWILNRKTKRVPVTRTAWNILNNQLSLCNNPIEAFEIVVGSGWLSFKAEWINKAKSNETFFDHNTTGWAKDLDKDLF